MARPLDAKLYARIVREAKARFDVWPSAYASGWVVRRYKDMGGRYEGGSKKPAGALLGRWFREEWVNVCELPRIVPCGRPKATGGGYPYCRPRKRVSSATPETVGELSARELEARCARKKQNPHKKIMPEKKEKVKYKNGRGVGHNDATPPKTTIVV